MVWYLHGMLQCDMEWDGVEWNGVVLCGMVLVCGSMNYCYVVVWYGIVWNGMV